VQIKGSAYCLTTKRFEQEFARHGEMQRVLLLYAQVLLTQTAQTAVCNRYHSVDEQLCRWLLTALDRLPTNRLTITQELLGSMLGVRRESVSQAAGKLQQLGVITYSRGQVTVIDRLPLEMRCCECYAVVRKETDRLCLVVR
jgi:CRP-like cAMP-binding protein